MKAAWIGREAGAARQIVAATLLPSAAALGAAFGSPAVHTQVAILAVGVMLVGTPHGGLDHRLGRRLLVPSTGAAWPLAFAVGYIGLGAATAAFWLYWPAAGLTIFLLLSWAHFGEADARESWPVVAVVARGGLPLVVPALAHPDGLDAIFNWLAGVEGARLGALLRGPVAWVWVAALVTHLTQMRAVQRGAALEIVALAIAATVLPPLLSFTLFFCLVHAPRALMETARMSGEGTSELLRAAAPLSLAATAAAALAYLAFAAEAPPAVAAVRTVFIWLAALTVPHMLLARLARQRTIDGSA